MIKTTFGLLFLGAGFLLAAPLTLRAAITIVDEGKSLYTIVVAEEAPSSVQEAAVELQRDLSLATKVKLPIRKDHEEIAGPVISLGATAQAKATGVVGTKIAVEGFHIRTKDKNLYILGPDTGDGEYTENGGTSNGTANGVYTFLEDYLGVRWLMPGELGLVVPEKSTFEIPKLERTYNPGFVYRKLSYVQVTPAIEEWKTRQKLGFSYRLNWGHNWFPTVPATLYKTHPEWFAMVDGKRVDPASLGNRYKLETTNPEVVNYYAQQAISALKADPHLNTFSLVPNDSRGWSESPESKALYDPPAPGSDFPSMTPLILKWYRDVAAIVAREYPQGKVVGNLYTDFSYPPKQGEMKLPDNLVPVINERGFGYRFYREEVRREAEYLMKEWAKVAPETWFYYGLPIWMRSSTGMLTTAAPDNLNFVFSLLRKYHIKGAGLYGAYSWSQASMGNYIEAKMMWNPELDAHELQRDWLEHAYGPKAGAVMGELYHQMDNGAWADYFRKDPSQHYNVRETLFKDYYGPHYPKIESYFLRAKNQPMTDRQKQRLQLIEDNLVVLQWRLRNAGYLDERVKSPLQRSDEEVAKLLQQHHPRKLYKKFYEIETKPTITAVKEVRIGRPPLEAGDALNLPNADKIMLYATEDREISMKASNVAPGSSFLSYVVVENAADPAATVGDRVEGGILYGGKEMIFKAKANTLYFFKAESHGVAGTKALWDLLVEKGRLAKAGFHDGVLYLDGPSAPLYVYASPQLKEAFQEAAGVRFLSKEAGAVLQRLYPNARTIMDLDHEWRFQTDPAKNGLKEGYEQPERDDSSWKNLEATDYWQNQGFGDYQGTAWYRKTFTAPPLYLDDPVGVDRQQLLLYFGAVDGDAVVYVNGRKVGEHLPSAIGRGWDQPFVLDVTEATKPGENVVAVQVTKEKYKSGIYKGVKLMLSETAAK